MGKSVTKAIRISRKTLSKKLKTNFRKYINIRSGNDPKEADNLINELCENTGISRKKFMMYCNNKFSVMDVRELKLIAMELKVKMDELIEQEL